jgi:VWFA-related protein
MFSARVRLLAACVLLATGYWLLATDGYRLLATDIQQPTFKAGVTLVTTDAIPRDQNGRFVADLTRDNFTILEDNQPQAITSFMMVRGGRTYNLMLPTAESAPAEGLVLPKAKPRTDDTAGRVLIFFIDDLHFEPELSPHVRNIVKTLAEKLMHDGDMVAVVSSGPSYLQIGPTYDKKLVLEAVGKIRGTGLIPSEIFQSMETSQGPADIRTRAQNAFYTAYGILNDLESVSNKRKALIYVSTGYDFDPYAQGRAGADRIQGGRFSEPNRFYIDQENPYFQQSHITADIELHGLMKELTLSANRANTSIYTIDPRGLQGVVGADRYVDQSEWRTYLQKTISTLRYMSEETGGFAIVNTNDLEGELRRVDAETSDYYVLGFYSTNPDPQKRTRLLQVKVDRADITVSSRKEYSLKAAGKPPAPPPVPAKTKK